MREWTCGEQCLKGLKGDPKEFMDYKIWIWIWIFLHITCVWLAADHQPIEKNGDVTVTVTDKKLGRSQFYCGRCVYICVCVNIYIHQQGLMLEPHSKNNAFNVSPSSNVIVWGVNLKFSQLQVWDLTIRKPYSYKLVYNPIHLYIYYIRQNSKS